MTILSHLQQIHNPIKKRNHKHPVDSFIANNGSNLTFFSVDNPHQHSANLFINAFSVFLQALAFIKTIYTKLRPNY